MKRQYLQLKDLIDLDKWQMVQDSLAEITGMAIITVDFRGIPVTTHSSCSEFCAKIRANPNTQKDCFKCDSRGGLEATRLNQPYIYICHSNIVDVAVPIVVQEKYLGAVMLGQVFLSETESDSPDLEHVYPLIDIASIDPCLQTAYKHLPKMSYRKIEMTANIIFQLVNYILDEAINKNAMISSYEWMIKKSSGNMAHPLEDLSLRNMIQLMDTVSHAITQKQMNIRTPEEESFKSVHYSIRPAIEFVHSHFRDTISMEEMAKLCHLSQSYFSKLFAKEMGETFTAYVTKLKLRHAKQMLQETDATISKIAEELSFSDDGYFIRVFKKHEGITPSVYRRHSPKL